MYKSFSLFVCSLISFLSPVFGERVEKASWNVGFSILVPQGLPHDFSYLSSSIPRMLRDSLVDIEEHQLSPLEYAFYQDRYFRDKLVSLRKEKAKLHDERDLLLFDISDKQEYEERYNDLSKTIQGKEEEIDLWLKEDPRGFEFPQSLPLNLVSFQEEALLFSPSPERAQRSMVGKDLDFVVTGSLDRIEQRFLLTLRLLSQAEEGGVLVEFNRVCLEEEIPEVVEEASREFRIFLLGRSWAELEVSASPPDAMILIDGKSFGVGRINPKDLEPGFMLLTVRASGYESESRQIFLPPGEKLVLEIDLVKGEQNLLYISSTPPEADVYLGATWVGRTPFVLEKPEGGATLALRKEGFVPFTLISTEIEGDSLEVRLAEEEAYGVDPVQEAKGRFYSSLGWFALSTVIPLISYGLAENYYFLRTAYLSDYRSTFNPDSLSKSSRYGDYSLFAQRGILVGAGLSLGLLVNSLFKLREYIKAAESSVEG